jgi:hypothetical protein
VSAVWVREKSGSGTGRVRWRVVIYRILGSIGRCQM